MRIVPLLAAFAALAFVGCDFLVGEEEPRAAERLKTFELIVEDASDANAFEQIYGSSRVPFATITLKSVSLQNTYTLVADSTGTARLERAISDDYVVTARRPLSPDEYEAVFGFASPHHTLVNASQGIIELRADVADPLTIRLDDIRADAPLLISEIYACGPPDAGLYYHDKYVEVFNNSDSTLYLDGLTIARVYNSSYLGLNYVDDSEFVHSKTVWYFPGDGDDYPIEPGEFVVCAEDGMDHRINAPESVDLSGVSFEFFKNDAPDVDNPGVPNMLMLYQSSGYDWLIGGEKEGLVIADMALDSVIWRDDQILVPISTVIDGVEYLDDVTELDEKTLYPGVDAGVTGGIEFYTGKSMERIVDPTATEFRLQDQNNSSLDFTVIEDPTPEWHYTQGDQ